MWARYFENFDVLSLTGHDDFLPIVLGVQVVGAWTHQTGGLGGVSGFRLHAPERHIGLWDFVVALNSKVVAS